MHNCREMVTPPARALAVPDRPWQILLRAAVLAAAVAAPVAPGMAAERDPSACIGFCRPLESTQLDGQRAQGLTVPNGDMKLGVILWDEYRRVQPSDSGAPANGIAVSGGTVFVNSAVTGANLR